jgi:hypothetical protein
MNGRALATEGTGHYFRCESGDGAGSGATGPAGGLRLDPERIPALRALQVVLWGGAATPIR